MKTTTFVILSLLCAAFVVADDPPEPPKFTPAGHTTDTLETVRERLKEKSGILLDVREQDEWDAGHLKDAKFVPLSAVRDNTLTKEMKKHLPKDKPVYVHCRSGGRVLIFSELLREQGYDIRPLRAGYEKLLTEGFEKAVEPKP